MYKYETHLHTSPVSRCARASAEESLRFYKEQGYDGVFITNHFIDSNIGISEDCSYEEKIKFYFSDYEKALIAGEEMNIKVFCGVEMSVNGTDFLVYGCDKEWFLSHPETATAEMSHRLEMLKSVGALIIQAHPYREASYIDHIRLYPRNIHGTEVENACRSDFENKMAHLYAENYNLIKFAGSDNHVAGNIHKLAGIQTPSPITDERDFIERILSGNFEIFTETRQQ